MTVLRDYAARVAQPTLGRRARRARYDEVVAPDGALRPAVEGAGRGRRSGSPPTTCAASTTTSCASLADDGVTYARPGERPGPVAARPGAAGHRRRPVDAARGRPGPARRAAQRGPGRPVRRAAAARRRARSRPPSCSATPASPGWWPGRRRSTRGRWCWPRPTSAATPTASGGCSADRAQAPSGIGLRDGEPAGDLAGAARALPRGRPAPDGAVLLRRCARRCCSRPPGDLADPRVVVLSPGTHSETAYDQAFVASALGFPLVQGSDLVVRDGWVLDARRPAPSGDRLERVDVILRRVDASWSDPLELRGDSQLGVAGLVEAVRRGRVRVVNGLGAGVLENPGLLPFLPAALRGAARRAAAAARRCRPGGAATPTALEHVLDRLDRLAGAGRSTGRPRPWPGLPRRRELARAGRSPRRTATSARSGSPLSQAPTWGAAAGGRVAAAARSRCARSRCATGRRTAPWSAAWPTSYDGGRGRPVVEQGRVGAQGRAAGDPDQGLADVLPMTSARSVDRAWCRASLEDMFWFGRYAERAEDLLRLVLATHVLGRGLPHPPALHRRRRPGRAARAVRPARAGRRARRPRTPSSARCCSTPTGRARSAHVAGRAARRAGRGARPALARHRGGSSARPTGRPQALRASSRTATRSPSRPAGCSPASCRCRA